MRRKIEPAVFVMAMSILGLAAVHPSALPAQRRGQLQNRELIWRYRVWRGQLRQVRIVNQLTGAALALPRENFIVHLANGRELTASDFTLTGPPRLKPLPAQAAASQAGKHVAGRELIASYAAPHWHLAAVWRVRLRRGANYIRERLTLRAVGRRVSLKKLVLFQEPLPGARTAGTVAGSPIVAGNFFFGLEQPLAQNTVKQGRASCALLRNAVLAPGHPLHESLVIGVAHPGQMRRDFLAYIERTRAHPYRPFLQYNSWYDLRNYTTRQAVGAIQALGEELTVKRGVPVAAYLFDDGWDNHRSLWQFSPRLPQGFAPLAREARKMRSALGVWLSPFGGYGRARKARLRYGRAQGFETDAAGFSLAGPKYYRRFRAICERMIRRYGVREFKFDGLAAGPRAGEAGLTADYDAMLRLLVQLRRLEPGLFINQTTGTWPSPFWLRYVDSTWRGGDDHSFYGPGDQPQRWITYRDMMTYRDVVERAPLYPLNSLMLHGIIYARLALRLKHSSDRDFADQVWDFFGSGTQTQELYLTPALLDRRNWHDLAAAALWARRNARTLVDTHWVGGDPGLGQVYGWAAWSPARAILTLRNPSAHPAVFTADAQELFQLPAGAARTYRMRSPGKNSARPMIRLRAGQPRVLHLRPFEVLVLESGAPR